MSACLKLIMMQIRKSGHTCHGLRLWLFGDKDHAFASDSEPQRLKIQGHKNIKHRNESTATQSFTLAASIVSIHEFFVTDCRTQDLSCP